MEAIESALAMAKQKTMVFPSQKCLMRAGPGRSGHAEVEQIPLPRPGESISLTRSHLAPSSVVYSRSKPVAALEVNLDVSFI